MPSDRKWGTGGACRRSTTSLEVSHLSRRSGQATPVKLFLSTAASRQSESADLGECMIANTLAESESVPVRRPVFANAFLHMAVKRPSRQRAWVGSSLAAMEAVGMSRHAKVQTPKPKRPMTRLGLPDLDHSKSAVLDSLRPPESKRGYRKRDWAILAVLLGCGLRRRELADLEFRHLQQREEHWAIVDLVGKGGHIRTVPLPDWVKTTIDEWLAAAAISAGKSVPMCLSGRQALGRGRNRTVSLARRETVREKTRASASSAA